ncbi:MAG: DOMON domain-containing protein [Bacteroidota bacterium]
MSWTCQAEGDYLVMSLQAPTTGWLGVGFNDKNDIMHSDLLLFHVVNGRASGQDMYVKGLGNPRLDSRLGGLDDIEILAAEERDGQTYIRFRRPYPVKDKYDYLLRAGEEFWLILAYSTHDEFAHHSRMRQHVKLKLSLD